MNWIHDAVCYNIYPLGFTGAPKENDYQLCYRLDRVYDFIPHLKKMGVNTILFNPLFQSSRHGYDTVDYYTVDSRLGDNKSFKKLCDTLHDNGFRILLDGVFNHVGRDFFAFRDLQQNGWGSRYKDWFHQVNFDNKSPYGDNFSYEGWKGHYELVKLNLWNDEVVEHLLGAVRFWIDEFGINGLRLDAADCVEMGFFKKLRECVRMKDPQFWLFGEIIHGDYNRWANPEALDSVTNYEIYKALYSCHNDRNYFEFAHSLDRECGDWGLYKGLYLYNFADNHDVSRVASIIRDKRLLKNVYTMLYTMPGMPSIYYGSEFAVEGKIEYGSDENVRREMRLDRLENPDYALFEHICRLSKLKHALNALQYGKYKNESIQLDHLCYSMKSDDQSLFILLNQADEPRTIGFDTGRDGVLTDMLTGSSYACQGWTQIEVPPTSSMILLYSDGSCPVDLDDAEPKADTSEQREEQEAPLIPEAITPGRYRHFKGNEYEVIDIAKDSETTEPMVVYRALYGERELWVRPYEMFREIIERDGKRMRRFERIE